MIVTITVKEEDIVLWLLERAGLKLSENKRASLDEVSYMGCEAEFMLVVE